MAQIDPSIALSIKPIQVESPLVHAARAAELQGAQQTQFMNMLKMKEFADESRNKNAMTQWLASSPNLDDDINLNHLATQFGAQGLALAKQIDDRRKARGEADYRAAQITDLESQRAKRGYDLDKARREDAIRMISSFPNRQAAIDMLYESRANKTISDEAAENILRMMPYNEEDFPAFQQKLISQLASPDAIMGADKPVVVGDKLVSRKGEVIFSPEPKAPTDPELVKEYKFATDPARGKQQFKGSLLDFKEAFARAGRTPAQGDNPNKVAHTSTDDQGNVTFYNAFGQVIRTQTNAGKRSPNLIKAEQAEKNLSRDIERATVELADITKDGGLIDQSTGSYAGKAVDIGARIFGKATPGDIAAGKLAPIADMVLKMVPRFEGPQSDKDTRSYKEAAGQLADSTLPTEIRKEAGKLILRLMKDRKGQFAGEGMDMSPEQRRAAPPPPAGFVPDKK